MKKTHQPEAADKAQDHQVQPLTKEEIAQVSGGHGTSRMGQASVSAGSNTASGRKTVYHSR
ncbi:hypothetical protein [Achromobacter marplatensis]|uniref:hypothetical protein n=1 Tax=Achromobacter marplatensis TaxID=470868 RepID=UPI0039F64C2E